MQQCSQDSFFDLLISKEPAAEPTTDETIIRSCHWEYRPCAIDDAVMQSVSWLLGQPITSNDDHGDVRIEATRPNRWGSSGHWKYCQYEIKDIVIQSVAWLLDQPITSNDAHGDVRIEQIDPTDGRVGGHSFLYTWLHCECCG